MSAASETAPEPYGLRGLLPFLSRRRREVVLTALTGVIGHVATIAVLALAAWLMGRALSQSPADAAGPLVLLGACVTLAAIGRWLQSWFGHDLAFALVEVLQLGIFDGLERAAPRYVLGRRTGDMSAAAIGDASSLEGFYAHLLADYIGAAIAPVAAIVVLAMLHPLAALVAIVFAPLIATTPFWLARRAGRQGDVVRATAGKLNADVVDGVQGVRELLAFGGEARFLDRLDRAGREVGAAQRAYGARAGVEHAVVQLLLNAVMLASAVLAVWLLARGEIDVSVAPVITVLSAIAMAPLTQAAESARGLGELRASAKRVLTMLHQPATVPVAADASAPTAGEIRFEDVRFAYAPGAPPVLDGASFTIAAGETVALVGESGVGKTTCANLLLRFWDVDGGRITLDGQDLRRLDVAGLRHMMGFVPQDSHIFNLSVADNIRLGRPDASDEEVRAAAAVAQADGFIADLPEGFASICGERGQRLSGGQRQRLALARAILTRAPVLILDEPAANLDAENARALDLALRQVRRGRTVLVIAHRLSTIRAADRVVMLRDGRVVETGTHDDLVARGGAYAAFVAAQPDADGPPRPGQA